jgi:phosphoglycerate dehydrogenase-like enzyme
MPDGPIIIVDPWPRRMGLVFTPETRARLDAMGELVLHEEGRMPDAMLDEALPQAVALIGQSDLPAARLARAPKLRAVINVEGNFLPNVDYAECARRGISVLSVAPCFSLPVAEMGLGLALDLARGITSTDRAFRNGAEEYGLIANRASFLLTGSPVGLVGYGNLGRALRPLLQPFGGTVRVYDPWLPPGYVREQRCLPASLDEVLATSRVIFLLAAVTEESKGLIGRREIELMQPGAVVVLLSRAPLVEWDPFVEAARSGRIRAATDVFPQEPVAPDDPVRAVPELLLSSHRAGGIPEAFRTMGEMVVDDLELILRGLPPVRLQQARPETAGRMRSAPGRTYAKGTTL